MRALVISLSIILLAACASTTDMPEEIIDPEMADGQLMSLPAQNLARDECGLFVWTRQAPHLFILFDPQGGEALILVRGSMVSMTTRSSSHDWSTGQSIERTYSSPLSGPDYTLSGTIGREGPAGWPLDDGLLKTGFEDGTQAIMPVIGVYSCNTGMPDIAAGTTSSY